MTTRARILTGGIWLLNLLALHGVLAFYEPAEGAAEAAARPLAELEATEEHVEVHSDDARPVPGFAEGAPDEDVDLAPAAAPEEALLPLATRPGGLDLSRISEVGDHLMADLGNGWTGELTTDVGLQRYAQTVLDRGKIPFGAVVVLDVKTGDVLAMADRYDE